MASPGSPRSQERRSASPFLLGLDGRIFPDLATATLMLGCLLILEVPERRAWPPDQLDFARQMPVCRYIGEGRASILENLGTR